MKRWIIFGLAFALYFVSVFGGFIQDDIVAVQERTNLGEIESLFKVWVSPYFTDQSSGAYRPLTAFTYHLNAMFLGKSAGGFRLFNILMYSCLCVLVYEMLKKLEVKENWAFCAALVFAMHPLHTEVVNNIVGRGEMLSMMGIIVAIYFAKEQRWEWSFVGLLMAILAKETGMVGVPIVGYLMLGEKDKEKRTALFVMLGGIILGYILIRFLVLGDGVLGNNATIVENQLKFVDSVTRMRTSLSLLTFGMGKILWPINLSYDYSFSQLKNVTDWVDWKMWMGLSMIVASIVSLVSKLRKNELWVMGMMMFWGSWLLTGNFVFTIGTIFGERLWFLPSLGIVFLFFAWFEVHKNTCFYTNKILTHGAQISVLARSPSTAGHRPRGICITVAYILFVFLLVFLTARTFVRNLDWLSQERLFVHDAKYVNGSVMAVSNEGAMRLLGRDFAGAKESLARADVIYPYYPQLMNNWGIYYEWQGEKEKAKTEYKKCMEKTNYYLCRENYLGLK